MKTNKFIGNVWLYLWSISIVLNCFSVYVREVGTVNYKLFTVFNLIFEAGGIVYGLIKLSAPRINLKNIVLGIGIYVTFLAPYILINLNKKFNLVYTLLYVPIGLAIYLYAESESDALFRLFNTIRNVVLVIAVVSLFFWMLTSVFRIITLPSAITIEWGGVHRFSGIKYLYYEVQHISIFGRNMARNSGLFVEPAVFGLILNFVFMVDTFFVHPGRLQKGNVIIGLAILSTTSTTNIAILFSTIVVNYICNQNSVSSFKKIGIPVIIIILVIVVKKLLGSKVGGESYSLRMDDFFSGIRAFQDHLIIGNGFGDSTAMIKYMNKKRVLEEKTGFSNGLLLVFIHGGVYLGLTYIYPLIYMLKKGMMKINLRFLSFPIMILILLSSTMAQYTELDIFIVLLCLFIPNYVAYRQN
ncbi:hypothetical protein [Lactiplantibacillus paraxiangfangensis]|uniref:hypothetical protein n=1 Tax=Lactiplantibacillus paraxiangfangensis TaxID=3076224 RepID=UPI0030C7653D